MKDIIKKILRESDFDWMDDINPLKGRGGVGYVALLYAEDTKAKNFVCYDGDIKGYPPNTNWKDVLSDDPELWEVCLFRTKREAQKAIQQTKKWRNEYPMAKYYDRYSIEKI